MALTCLPTVNAILRLFVTLAFIDALVVCLCPFSGKPQATSMALASFPALNASLSEDEKSVLLHPDHNIGVAMDTERGLLVPCISAVQEKSILQIAEV